MDAKKNERLSDEYTEYSGSAKSVSSRIKNAARLVDELAQKKTGKGEPDKESAKPEAYDKAAGKPKPGDGANDPEAEKAALGTEQDGDPTTEDGSGELAEGQEVVEPPAPRKLTEQELAKHPSEFLDEIDDRGDENSEGDEEESPEEREQKEQLGEDNSDLERRGDDDDGDSDGS